MHCVEQRNLQIFQHSLVLAHAEDHFLCDTCRRPHGLGPSIRTHARARTHTHVMHTPPLIHRTPRWFVCRHLTSWRSNTPVLPRQRCRSVVAAPHASFSSTKTTPRLSCSTKTPLPYMGNHLRNSRLLSSLSVTCTQNSTTLTRKTSSALMLPTYV